MAGNCFGLLNRLIKGGVRDVDDEAQLMAEFAELRARNPDAGIVAGVLHIGAAHFTIDVGSAHFSPVHWVALADSCMEHAIKRIANVAEPHPDDVDLICMIERARAELDFTDESRSAQ